MTDNATLFPQGDSHGMQLRDWFAGQALVRLLVANTDHRHEVQDTAYEIAGRMLDARRSP